MILVENYDLDEINHYLIFGVSAIDLDWDFFSNLIDNDIKYFIQCKYRTLKMAAPSAPKF